jgi:peptidoglycan/xylan/chitin deacetylase (PgdA/CDA1 family)
MLRRQTAPRKVPAILYHDVQRVSLPGIERWTVSPDLFAQHLDVIAASGRVALTLGEFAECLRGERPLERDAVLVTFDDGYASTYPAVLELVRRGMTASVFITTGTIDGEGMLETSEIRSLARVPGVEIGAHTISHPRVDELTGDALAHEIGGSKQALETILGAPVATFAYPHGSHDRRSRQAVIDAGFRAAAAIKNSVSHLADDPFAIARWTVTAETSPQQLARVLRGEGVPTAWRHERLRTRASRVVRRARRRLAVTAPASHA